MVVWFVLSSFTVKISAVRRTAGEDLRRGVEFDDFDCRCFVCFLFHFNNLF